MKKHAADNLLFLRDHYPDIYHAIRNTAYDTARCVPGLAKNGQPILTIVDGGRETSMYSRYNPELEAERWLESLRLEENPKDNILLFGFGFGYHAAAVMRAFPDRKLYIYEPDPDIFLAAVESVDLRPILAGKQIAMFAVGDDTGIHENLLLNLFRSSVGSFSFIAPPFYRNKYAGVIEKLSKQARKSALSYTVDMNTIRLFRKEWIENILTNTRRNLHTRSFSGMRDSCAGIPAVIAGSGPSLGMEIDKLKAVRNRVLLIAAGSSIQSLLHHGVEPDLIVSMDAGEANRRVFEKLDVGHIPFLYISTIKHSAIRDDRSPYLMHAYFDFDTLSRFIMDVGEEDVVFSTSSTVTGTAIQAAVWLGCRDVVLIGQDFSFPGNAAYASGIGHFVGKAAERRVASAKLTVPNVSGGVNRTNSSMLNLKHGTEAIMAQLPQVRFYNASPVGAVIEHTEPLSLDELPVRLPTEGRPGGWFKRLVLERAKPLAPGRVDLVRQRVVRFGGQLADFKETFGRVEALAEEAKGLIAALPQTSRIEAWFASFDQYWPLLLEHPVYKQVFQLYLASEYTHAGKFWPDMLAEKDPAGKLEKLLYCILPMVEAMHALIPVFEVGLDRWKESD